MGRKGNHALAPSTLNMLPKLELAPMRMYLQDVREHFAAFEHAFFQHHQIFFQQNHVGGFLGDVHRGVHGNAHVGGAQRRGVVDAIAQEADDMAFRRWSACTTRFLCAGERRAKTSVVSTSAASCSSDKFSTWLPSRIFSA